MIKALLILSLVVLCFGQDASTYKHLGGPPEEFHLHDLPDPTNVLTTERSYYIPVYFDSPDPITNVVYTVDFPVDGPSDFMFTFSSPHEDRIDLELFDPSGKMVSLEAGKFESFYPIGLEYKLPVTAYIIKNSVAGVYKLNLKTDLTAQEISDLKQSNPVPNAALILLNNDYIQIQTHLSSYLIKAGNPIGLVSTIIDSTPTSSIQNIEITSAELEIIAPDGTEIDVPMTDDASFLTAKDDGAYGAEVTAKTPGQYTLQAKLAGTYQDAGLLNTVQFVRTTQHFIDVSSATIELSGTASAHPKDAQTININIGVKNIQNTQPQLRAYAQVWGVDPKTQQSSPAAWIGGYVTISGETVTLELNLNWLQRAGVTGPLTLKGVYLADVEKSFPVASYDGEIAVTGSENMAFSLSPELLNMEITEQMRFGANPLKKLNSSFIAKSALVLSGGYCSNNPWAPSAADFVNAVYPVYNGNFPHASYADKIMTYTRQQGLDSWSIVGHSQGGAVGTHIQNYHWTGLDLSTGGRKIQSVGTPYQGCTGAGSAANMIKLFGIGCGANNDLTTDGSNAWLAGISSATRANVCYYTTTYQQGNLFGDYCNLAVNALLKWPNDGTTEIALAKLTGGKDLGNTQKQCHTTGMSYIPQYEDHARNREMSAAAAR